MRLRRLRCAATTAERVASAISATAPTAMPAMTPAPRPALGAPVTPALPPPGAAPSLGSGTSVTGETERTATVAPDVLKAAACSARARAAPAGAGTSAISAPRVWNRVASAGVVVALPAMLAEKKPASAMAAELTAATGASST